MFYFLKTEQNHFSASMLFSPSIINSMTLQHLSQSWMRAGCYDFEHKIKKELLERWMAVVSEESMRALTGEKNLSWVVEGEKIWFNIEQLSASEIGLWAILLHQRLMKDAEKSIVINHKNNDGLVDIWKVISLDVPDWKTLMDWGREIMVSPCFDVERWKKFIQSIRSNKSVQYSIALKGVDHPTKKLAREILFNVVSHLKKQNLLNLDKPNNHWHYQQIVDFSWLEEKKWIQLADREKSWGACLSEWKEDYWFHERMVHEWVKIWYKWRNENNFMKSSKESNEMIAYRVAWAKGMSRAVLHHAYKVNLNGSGGLVQQHRSKKSELDIFLSMYAREEFREEIGDDSTLLEIKEWSWEKEATEHEKDFSTLIKNAESQCEQFKSNLYAWFLASNTVGGEEDGEGHQKIKKRL